MRFKEHERFAVFLAVLTGPSWGQSRPGSQGPDTLIHPKGIPARRPRVACNNVDPRTKPSPRARRQRVTHRLGCKQPIREEGTPTCPEFRPRSPVTIPRNASACHSPTRLQAANTGGGHGTCTFMHTGSECRTPSLAATAPLPERQHHPFEKTGG
jgi:hypothetical protein